MDLPVLVEHKMIVMSDQPNIKTKSSKLNGTSDDGINAIKDKKKSDKEKKSDKKRDRRDKGERERSRSDEKHNSDRRDNDKKDKKVKDPRKENGRPSSEKDDRKDSRKKTSSISRSRSTDDKDYKKIREKTVEKDKKTKDDRKKDSRRENRRSSPKKKRSSDFDDYVNSSVSKLNDSMRIDFKFEEPKYDPNLNFFADSPYYDAFADKEMDSFGILSAFLSDIGGKVFTFTKAGALLSKATRNLALSCQLTCYEDLELVQKALGPELSSLFDQVGQSLKTIACEQDKMYEIFKDSFGQQLQNRVDQEMKRASMLKREAMNQTQIAESMFSRHLNGNETVNSQTNNIEQATISKMLIQHTTAEINRFQFFRHLVESRCQTTFVLSQIVSRTFSSLQTYFAVTSKTLQALEPEVDSNIEKCEQFLSNHKLNESPAWENRLDSLVETLTKMKMEALEETNQNNNNNNNNYTSFRGLASSSPSKVIISPEQELKLWELPEKLATCSKFLRDSPPGVQVEGWLYQQHATTSWNRRTVTYDRRWFILKNGAIYCLQPPENTSSNTENNTNSSLIIPDKIKICDVTLCTVREFKEADVAKPRFGFELISSNQNAIVLRARGPNDVKMWINGIRSAIEKHLAKGSNTESEDANRKPSSEVNFSIDKSTLSMFRKLDKGNVNVTTINEDFEKEDEVVEIIMKRNRTCADCGSAAPDWVSLNLGILVCLECSGVHRSLGVHVSKVRSLTLDALSEGESAVFLSLGNKRMNEIYERRVKKGMKPASFEDRKTREEWIRSKYVEKAFVSASGKASDPQTLLKYLFDAAKMLNIVGIAKALAYGADVDWENANEGGKTALQICNALKEEGVDNAMQCAELLIQNGAKI